MAFLTKKWTVNFNFFCMMLSTLLFASPLTANSAHETVRHVTTLSKEARPSNYLYALSDHGYTLLRAEQRAHEREVLIRVRKLLPDYSEATLRESVKQFLIHQLKFPSVSMIEFPSKRPKETTFIASDGKKEMYVRVFCSDKEHEALVHPDFSKAYRTRDSHFLRQLAAGELFQSLHLSQLHTLKHLAVGYCQLDGSYYYFVAGHNPPGDSMQLLYKDIFNAPKASNQQLRAIHRFKKALVKLAITLGEIHSKNVTPIEVTPEILLSFQSRIDAKLEAYTQAGGQHTERIRSVLQRQLEELGYSKTSLTYYHGCALLKKFFYDDNSDKLSLKELYEAHSCVGREGQPVGLFLGHDIHSPLEEMRFEALHFEEESAIAEELCELFEETYRKTVGEFYQPALSQLEQSLRRLERYPECLKGGEERKDNEDIFKKRCLALCNKLFLSS